MLCPTRQVASGVRFLFYSWASYGNLAVSLCEALILELLLLYDSSCKGTDCDHRGCRDGFVPSYPLPTQTASDQLPDFEE